MKGGNPPYYNDINKDDAWLPEDETLIDQCKERGLTATLEHIRDYAAYEPRDCLWAGACMSNGKFSLTCEDMHNLFEGTEISETQKWVFRLGGVPALDYIAVLAGGLGPLGSSQTWAPTD
jgi:hypothetical protein